MASSLFELMKPEIDQYADDREKDIYLSQAKIMLQHGSDNDYIKLLTHLSDADINELRETTQAAGEKREGRTFSCRVYTS